MSTLDWLNDDNIVPELYTDDSSGVPNNSTVHKPREALMQDIEQTIMQVIESVSIGQPIKVPLSVRKLPSRVYVNYIDRIYHNNYLFSKRKTANHDQQTNREEQTSIDNQIRTLSLSTGSSAKTLARYFSVLQMIYEAIAHRIIITKRDMYYRDVGLFVTQSVVDTIVDDIACHYNVPRSSLNVSASSKGLIFGPIVIKLKNNKILDCMTHMPTLNCHDEQGILIPPVNQIAEIKFSIGFCQTLPQSCILVTGKGYPDLLTRQFVKHFSIQYSRLPILALMDNDPHGLDIYATYKWGARALAFDVSNLAVQSIQLIGLTCQDRIDFNIPSEYLIPLTERDKAKCLCMVRTFDASETPGASQMRERGWKDIGMQVTSQSHRDYIKEVFELLRTDYKCELQALYAVGPYGLSHFLMKKLPEYI
ncbi:hypothetical protein G6F70_002140 [Rhizopus microsporus]|nr:hypothetical protein G6F71_000705 [Rhizopus microsporus]KAG1202577.1 hypothetical protein G6F70_002140 [Rhizopus microsporus]KAG1212134.1 hypothetical protein G6F69_003984 [Rhizopus microsporus]KAG1232303.1 hypothetical protein G6F67_005115 [Rhizopus microsporus]KAG1266321.1 hypothetical protein G6F68_002860 [Rhizopus microsporus]